MMSNVNDVVRTIADVMKERMEIGEGGLNTVPKEVYEEHLPEGVDMKMAEKVMGHNERMTAALTLANGEYAMGAMQKDKSLQKVSTTMKYGRFGEATSSFERSAEGRKSVADPTIVTRYGVTSTKVKTTAGRNRGDLKKVREGLAQQAADLFN